MNILLIAYHKYFDTYPEILKAIEKKVNSMGHSFKSSYSILKENPDHVDFFREMELAKKEADMVIADISFNSTGLGHDISWALTNRKPTLLTYSSDRADEISNVLLNRSKKEKLLFSKKYSNSKDIDKIISNFIKEASEKIDTKFILIISPEIDRYLEWAADYKRMHKAQIVRNAVEKEMERDPEYKEFLKLKEK